MKNLLTGRRKWLIFTLELVLGVSSVFISTVTPTHSVWVSSISPFGFSLMEDEGEGLAGCCVTRSSLLIFQITKWKNSWCASQWTQPASKFTPTLSSPVFIRCAYHVREHDLHFETRPLVQAAKCLQNNILFTHVTALLHGVTSHCISK